MDFLDGTIEQQSIKENQDKITEEGVRFCILNTLKRGWDIAEAKGNDEELIMIFMST